MRIHIGKISPALADKIEELEKRLDRYGKLNGGISLHRKPYGDFFFAFVDMELDQKQYGALRTAFNGVMFRQSKLELKIAKPSSLEIYQKKLAEEANSAKHEPRLNIEQIKRSKSVHPRKANVFPGRYRDEIRENPTFRCEIDGKLKKVRMKKRKMWGVERRPLDRLVHHFEEGEWRDSENRAIEIIAELHDEYARDQRIAENFVKDDTGFLSDSDFEEFKANARELAPAEYVDDEIEIVSKELGPIKNTNPVDSVSESSDPEESEEPKGNITESLRSALSTQDVPFTLFGGDLGDSNEAMDIELPSTIPTTTLEASKPKLGLFFAHESSPYLRSQSQAAKLVASFDPKSWEEEFYAHRGEWNRELRQRQRDVLRKARRMGKKRGE